MKKRKGRKNLEKKRKGSRVKCKSGKEREIKRK